MEGGGVIESREQFAEGEDGYDDPRAKYKYWREELKASIKAREKWWKQGDKVVKRFLDERRDTEVAVHGDVVPFRLNLFHSNVQTLQSMLYGNVPTVDVSRRYADPSDDASRVAAEMMERLLNNDIADRNDEYNSVLRAALQDRLLPGLGCARLRYEVETEESEATVIGIDGGAATQETQTMERVVWEDAPVDYFHWRDVLWGWARTWDELPWIAYRSWLKKEEVIERWGEEVADDIEFKRQMISASDDSRNDPDTEDPWMKAEIWEVWDKERRQICYVCLNGPAKVLESRDDPLELDGFFPSPPFLLANQTTSNYQPVSDFHLAQDLYNEIDKLQTRIAIITEAVKVVGVYDSGAEGIQRMFKEGVDNTLIPVDNWALFAEKGGIQGQIDWVPLEEVVNALGRLREIRDETIQLLFQTTGMADIMRGADSGQYEAAATSQMKAKFASVRVQALQDQFADFASNIMALKAEIISKHFSPETIVRRANIENTFDAQLVPQALSIIKDWVKARLRVKIRPESVAMVDYAQLKQERTEFINALSMFMQSAGPLMEQSPALVPHLMQLLQWGLAGFKGASEIEGVIDQAVQQMQKQQEQQQEQPDPAVQQEQAKAQAEQQKIQAKAQADLQARRVDMQADIRTMQQQHAAKMAEIRADMEAKIAEVQSKMEADISLELVKSRAMIETTRREQEGEIEKDVVEAQLDSGKEAVKTDARIAEIRESAAAKMQEIRLNAREKQNATQGEGEPEG